MKKLCLLLILAMALPVVGGGVCPFTTIFMRTLLDDADMAAAWVTLGIGSTDGTFASNSDTLIPTEKAIKTYVTNNAGSVSPLEMTELSADPVKPGEGENVIWMSDGTGSGDDGDLMIAATAGGVTKRAVLWDFSGASEWIDFLLLETGDALLLEIEDKLILEN